MKISKKFFKKIKPKISNFKNYLITEIIVESSNIKGFEE